MAMNENRVDFRGWARCFVMDSAVSRLFSNSKAIKDL